MVAGEGWVASVDLGTSSGGPVGRFAETESKKQTLTMNETL